MKLSFKFTCFITTIFIYSCNYSGGTFYHEIKLGDSTLIEKKIYDKNGSLIVEEILNKDSINDGYYKEFDNGKLSKLGNYQNGKKNGTWFYLDFAGDTIKAENWFSGKRFGEQIQYYIPMVHDNRHNIYKYSFLNLDGEELFRMLNDTVGNVINLRGFPLYCTFNKDSIEQGKSFVLMSFLGVPPRYKFNVAITETNLSKNKVLTYEEFDNETTSSKLINLNFGKKIMIEKIYSKRGNYDWKINLKLIDSLNTKIIVNDSTLINLEVY